MSTELTKCHARLHIYTVLCFLIFGHLSSLTRRMRIFMHISSSSVAHRFEYSSALDICTLNCQRVTRQPRKSAIYHSSASCALSFLHSQLPCHSFSRWLLLSGMQKKKKNRKEKLTSVSQKRTGNSLAARQMQ